MHGPAAAVVLLLLVVVLSGLSERFRLPPPVVLAVSGLLLGLVPGLELARISPDVIQAILLPLLLYAAARELPERELRQEARLLAALALGLVLTTALAVALTLPRIAPGFPFALALVLGAMLGATDPVAVTALARRLPLPRRLLVVAAGESLFNDATGLVLYRVALTAAVAGTGISVWRASAEFLLLAVGGALAGLVVAEASIRLRRLLHDPLMEGATSLLTPVLAFLAAELVHTSGIMAVVVAGIYVSTRGHRVLTTESRLGLGAVWDMIVFVLEGIIFLIIGLVLPTAVRALPDEQLSSVFWQAALITVVVIAVRIAWVFLTAGISLAMSLAVPRRGKGLSWQVQLALAWTGTRGAVALAAALSLPVSYGDGRPFSSREQLIVLTVAVVLLTLLLQGLTLGPLLRRLGLGSSDDGELRQQAMARARAARAALNRLDELQEAQDLAPDMVARLRLPLQARVQQGRDAAEPAEDAGQSSAETYSRLRLALLEVEREELTRLHQRGEISDTAWRQVLHGFDLEEARLTVGQA